MNKKGFVLSIAVGVAIAYVLGCNNGAVYKQKMSGKYGLLAIDSLKEMSVCELSPNGGGVEVIGATVYAVGWNDDYIVAEQSPSRSESPYFIIRVKDGKMWGPMTRIEFQEERIKQNVTKDLSFTLAFEELK